MSSWPSVKLGEVCLSIVDGDHQSMPISDSGIPFITISDIKDNRIDFTSARFVPLEYYAALDDTRKPYKGSVLYSVKGSFGIPVYVDSYRPFTFQRDIAIMKCKAELNPHYLYYVLKSPEYYKIADSLAIGSAQRALTLKTLRNLEIPFPDNKTQQQMVDYLSGYDNLIENNQRQIKLLEEAAQRQYKEWFVDLRFPEHENVSVVDGVPEGWHLGTLAEIVAFKRGNTITKTEVIEGKVPVVAGGLEPAYFHNSANTKAPVITVSGSGANAGYTRLYYENVFASDCSFADAEATPYIYFVYCFLKQNSEKIDALQKGSAQPHVYAKDINAIAISIPPVDLINKFCKCTNALFDSIGILQKQILSAKEARDRLLLKLMSGEIEI